MFTGLIVERGRLAEEPAPSEQGGVRLAITHSRELSERLQIGASLAVSGVCLTLVEYAAGSSVVELSPETLARTNLKGLEKGSEVNLEPALRMGDPLGGHWVQGHVDGTIELLDRKELQEHRELFFSLPDEHRMSVVEKGSVTLDGVSLTVAGLWEDRFSAALIPHTLEVTTLGSLEEGARVNFEADVLAKYVQRAIAGMGGVRS